MTTLIIPKKKARRMINKMIKNKLLGYLNKKKNKIENEKVESEVKRAYKKYTPKLPSKRFQHSSGTSITIFNEKSEAIYRHLGAMPKKKVNKIASRHPKATVMIDLGQGLFKQISIKTFKKLTKIKYVLFERSYEFFGIDGYEPESKSGDWFAPEAVIDHVYSMNQLIKLFVFEEAFDRANKVYLSGRFYDLTGAEKVCKVLYDSNRVVSMSLKKFLETYGLVIDTQGFTPKKKK
jgi:hypothetical protein